MFSFAAKEQINRIACEQLQAHSETGLTEVFSFTVIILQLRIKKTFFVRRKQSKMKLKLKILLTKWRASHFLKYKNCFYGLPLIADPRPDQSIVYTLMKPEAINHKNTHTLLTYWRSQILKRFLYFLSLLLLIKTDGYRSGTCDLIVT